MCGYKKSIDEKVSDLQKVVDAVNNKTCGCESRKALENIATGDHDHPTERFRRAWIFHTSEPAALVFHVIYCPFCGGLLPYE